MTNQIGRAAEPAPRRRSRAQFLRTTVAHRRSGVTDVLLGIVLAFIAGATNAGGFLAIGQYTSHMTGIASAIADNLALGLFGAVGAGIVAMVAFVAGAACSAVLINWGRRNDRTKQYAYPIALEALLLLGFGVLGTASREAPGFMALAAPLLCFIMGLQNATITKISGSRIRTTHLTGMVTDIGIELGKYAYWHRSKEKPDALRVKADLKKLSILLRIVGMFFAGGVVGALGFGHLGYIFSIPLAAVLFVLTSPRIVGGGRGRKA